MLAEQSLREGKIQEALEQLQEQVRNDPANPGYRVFLFQLLSVLGQWDRAANQLNVAGEMDPQTMMMVHTYKDLLQCEALRTEIFAGRRSPLVFGDPEPWVARMIEAARLSAEGNHPEAAALRDDALEQAEPSSGTINGDPFEWIADADPRLGPMLETVVMGRYYWIPFRRIKSIRMEAPSDLRDMVWTAAQFVWANGGTAVGMIPTRYAGSEVSEDSALQLARKTEWLNPAPDVFTGCGQRVLATDISELPLLEVREIILNNEDEDTLGDLTSGSSDG